MMKKMLFGFRERRPESKKTCSTGILTAFGQEGNIFSICCNTGEFC